MNVVLNNTDLEADRKCVIKCRYDNYLCFYNSWVTVFYCFNYTLCSFEAVFPLPDPMHLITAIKLYLKNLGLIFVGYQPSAFNLKEKFSLTETKILDQFRDA
jgi:hypothetical protein